MCVAALLLESSYILVVVVVLKAVEAVKVCCMCNYQDNHGMNNGKILGLIANQKPIRTRKTTFIYIYTPWARPDDYIFCIIGRRKCIWWNCLGHRAVHTYRHTPKSMISKLTFGQLHVRGIHYDPTKHIACLFLFSNIISHFLTFLISPMINGYRKNLFFFQTTN